MVDHGCDRPIESSVVHYSINRIDRFYGACREKISYILYKTSAKVGQ